MSLVTGSKSATSQQANESLSSVADDSTQTLLAKIDQLQHDLAEAQKKKHLKPLKPRSLQPSFKFHKPKSSILAKFLILYSKLLHSLTKLLVHYFTPLKP